MSVFVEEIEVIKAAPQAFEQEVPPLDFDIEPTPASSCDVELGYVALCASCPLLRMFGDCPKEIRELSSQADEAAEPFLLEGDNFLFFKAEDPFRVEAKDLSRAEPEDSINDKPEDPVCDKPEDQHYVESDRPSYAQLNKKLPADPADNIKIKIKSTTVNLPLPKVKIEKPRTFRDLLFDDSVPIVSIMSVNSAIPTTTTNPTIDKKPEIVTKNFPLETEISISKMVQESNPEKLTENFVKEFTPPNVLKQESPAPLMDELIDSPRQDLSTPQNDEIYEFVRPISTTPTVEIEVKSKVYTIDYTPKDSDTIFDDNNEEVLDCKDAVFVISDSDEPREDDGYSLEVVDAMSGSIIDTKPMGFAEVCIQPQKLADDGIQLPESVDTNTFANALTDTKCAEDLEGLANYVRPATAVDYPEKEQLYLLPDGPERTVSWQTHSAGTKNPLYLMLGILTMLKVVRLNA